MNRIKRGGALILSTAAITLTLLSISVSPYPFILTIAYIIHECGHLFFAKCVGAKINKFSISVFHLSLSYDATSLSYQRELLVSLGGIIFNLITATLLAILPFFNTNTKEFFVMCSYSLALMNLYPVSILDGGRISTCILNLLLKKERAEALEKTLSLIFALALWLISVYLQLVFETNLSLFIISVVLLVQLCFAHN